MVSYLRPFAFETVEVTDAAIATLDPDVFYETGVTVEKRQVAREATISVENEAIRFRIDGGNPTQSVGHLVPTGTVFTITTATALLNFKAVAIGEEATGTIQVTYFNS